MADCLQLLLGMDIIGGMACPFTNVIGFWLYAIGLLVLEVIIYQYFEDVLIPTGTGIIIGTLMITLLPPGVQVIGLTVFGANLCLMLYNLYTRRD